MPKFLHTADLHLGSPVSNLPEKVAAEIREGLFDTFARLCETARDERVDALIIAGDLFDTPVPPRSVASRAFELLGRAGVPVFIAPGNHDCLAPRSPYLMMELPQNVFVFRSERIERVDFADFTLYGAGFSSEYIDRPLLDGFRAEGGKPSIMALHGDLAASSRYNPISPEQIAASGLSYLALGHVHARSEAMRYGATVCAYPGCPAARGFDEEGDKGAYLVELNGGKADLRFVPSGAKRFVNLVKDEPTLGGGYERDLVRLEVVGEREPLDIKAVEDELGDKCLYIKVVDRTRLPRKVWQRAGEDTLAGAFLSALIAERERGANEAQIELAARYGLAALDGEEEPK